MNQEEPVPPKDAPAKEPDRGADDSQGHGFLVLKFKEGDGVLIDDEIEVRLATSRNNRADIAFRAPKGRKIRRIPSLP